MPLSYNPAEPQYPQQLDWSCAACSLAWLNRALGIQHATDEVWAIEYIGNPKNINACYGLMDGSGQRLVECLREQGAPAFSCWPSWTDTIGMSAVWPLLIGGVGWNHWVGVRGTDGHTLDLANSAEGWRDIYSTLDQTDWDRLGPFAVVAVPLLVHWPLMPHSM